MFSDLDAQNILDYSYERFHYSPLLWMQMIDIWIRYSELVTLEYHFFYAWIQAIHPLWNLDNRFINLNSYLASIRQFELLLDIHLPIWTDICHHSPWITTKYFCYFSHPWSSLHSPPVPSSTTTPSVPRAPWHPARSIHLLQTASSARTSATFPPLCEFWGVVPKRTCKRCSWRSLPWNTCLCTSLTFVDISFSMSSRWSCRSFWKEMS